MSEEVLAKTILPLVKRLTTEAMTLLISALFGALFVLNQVASATEAPRNFAIHETPKSLPDIRFEDGDGRSKTLADFSDKIVLLNIWATWCISCRKEMPTLDRLQTELGGADFEIVALSIDRAGPDAVKKFYIEIGIAHLALYIDASSEVMFALGVVGLPTTLLIDREGREIGRLIGPAEWDTPEMVAFIRRHIITN
ncbi:redoxin family protein [Mesorhizobium sp. CC13]|uniref:TlpA family protein disulfide reductase n=1 Tax=Mesorhizobium sp. CC13 TaxID=3029194 RepID=UPI003263685F